MTYRSCGRHESTPEDMENIMDTFHVMTYAMLGQATVLNRLMGRVDRRAEENLGGEGADQEYQNFSACCKANPPNF